MTDHAKVGRPTDYSVDVAATICGEIAEGASVASIAKRDDMPSSASIYKWLSIHREFAEMYKRACEERADVMAADIVRIADDESKAPDCRRVRIDARKWTAVKLNPRRYGDRINHAGDAENPIHHQVNIASQIMSTIHGAGRPLPAAGSTRHLGSEDDDREPEVASEQPLQN